MSAKHIMMTGVAAGNTRDEFTTGLNKIINKFQDELHLTVEVQYQYAHPNESLGTRHMALVIGRSNG